MQRALIGLTVLLVLAASAPAAEKPVTVSSVAQVEKLDPTVRSVIVGPVRAETIQALVERVPDLTDLWLQESSSVDLKSLTALKGFRKLTTLRFTGETSLGDAEVAALGELRTVRSLRLGLP